MIQASPFEHFFATNNHGFTPLTFFFFGFLLIFANILVGMDVFSTKYTTTSKYFIVFAMYFKAHLLQYNIESTARPSLTLENVSYAPALFLTILFCNVSSIFPHTYAMTGQFIICFFLAWFLIISFSVRKIKTYGLSVFISLFLPTTLSIYLRWFLLYTEVISYFARFFSLGGRLFSNIVAGHCLIKLLTVVLTIVLSLKTLGFFFGTLLSASIFILLFAVIFMENCLAFMQAYLFTLLTFIYDKELQLTPHNGHS